MADAKISALPASTTPLAGTEVLPIVQSSTTKKVSVANLTAGRDVTANSLALNTGDLLTQVFKATGINSAIYAPTNNPGYGVFFIQSDVGGANTVQFQTNSNGNTFIPTGSLGIGASSLTARLAIDTGDVATTALFVKGVNTEIYAPTNNPGYGVFSITSDVGGTRATQVQINSNGNTTLTTGNLVIGTAGKGITTGSSIPLGFGSNNGTSGMTLDTSNNLTVAGSVSTSGGYKVPYTLIETGIPFVLTSGSMANNGALTLTTAVATAYPNAYVYMPAGAIEAGSAAGWYYAVFSTTGAATIYNNTYSSGQPAIPASPTAFVTTGPGAFTFSTASSYSGVSVTLAANAMGINGSLEFIWTATANNSANAKYARALFGGQTPAGATSFTSQTNGRWNATVQNRGVANVQSTNGVQFSNGQLSAANSTTAINTASSVTVAGNLFLNTSTSDVLVMESFKVIVYPS